MKIMVTGGHLAPALAVIDEIKKIKPNTNIIFVGRKYALDLENTLSLEYKEITNLKIPFVPIQAGRLTRIFSIRSIRSFFRIPLGFINAFFIINQYRPDCVLSFGSFIALPTVFWAKVFKIKVITHEQTSRPGLANQIIGRMADQVYLSFPDNQSIFDAKKTRLIGNPLKKQIFMVIDKPFNIKKNKPVIYITGGSLGSHSINVLIEKILKSLVTKYIVIHQIGETKEYQDYERLVKLRQSLSKELRDNYYPVKHLMQNEIGYIYSLSDLVIGRSGANTFFELIALKKPAILIPLPWSSGKEQQYHAEILVKNQVGEIFHQIETADKLNRLIDQMINNLEKYQKNFSQLNQLYKTNASTIIAHQVTQ